MEQRLKNLAANIKELTDWRIEREANQVSLPLGRTTKILANRDIPYFTDVTLANPNPASFTVWLEVLINNELLWIAAQAK